MIRQLRYSCSRRAIRMQSDNHTVTVRAQSMCSELSHYDRRHITSTTSIYTFFSFSFSMDFLRLPSVVDALRLCVCLFIIHSSVVVYDVRRMGILWIVWCVKRQKQQANNIDWLWRMSEREATQRKRRQTKQSLSLVYLIFIIVSLRTEKINGTHLHTHLDVWRLHVNFIINALSELDAFRIVDFSYTPWLKLTTPTPHLLLHLDANQMNIRISLSVLHRSTCVWGERERETHSFSMCTADCFQFDICDFLIDTRRVPPFALCCVCEHRTVCYTHVGP